MDLIGGYLLVILVLFSANIALLLGNDKPGNIKLISIAVILSIVTFGLMNASAYFNISLLDYLSYFFFAIVAMLFILMIFCTRNNKINLCMYLVVALFLISVMVLSSQSILDNIFLYSLAVLIVILVVYQLSKLLHHAKRQYCVILGEYMCLFSVLMFILAFTYNSAMALDYTAFSPFLILTPTYQLIYIVIAIIVILVIGVLINDNKGGKS